MPAACCGATHRRCTHCGGSKTFGLGPIISTDLPDLLVDEDVRRAEAEAFEQVLAAIDWHIFPAVQIGFGAATLYHKLHAIIHATLCAYFWRCLLSFS